MACWLNPTLALILALIFWCCGRYLSSALHQALSQTDWERSARGTISPATWLFQHWSNYCVLSLSNQQLSIPGNAEELTKGPQMSAILDGKRYQSVFGSSFQSWCFVGIMDAPQWKAWQGTFGVPMHHP
jgi:hypothetical protein